MSFPDRMRMRVWLRESGCGWMLIPPALQVIQLGVLGGLRGGEHLDPGLNSVLLMSTVPMAMLMWMTAGQYQARLLLSSIELRVPRVLRTLCVALSGFAVWTILTLLAPIVILRGPYLQWLLFVSNAIGMGILVALFRGTWFETPISLGYVLVIGNAAIGSSLVSRQVVELLTIAMPFLIAWRLLVLVRVMRSGAGRDLFLRSLAATDGWKLAATWTVGSFREKTRLHQHTVDRSRTGVWRVCLGPLYERRVSWMLLCFAPAPILALLPACASYTGEFVKVIAVLALPVLWIYGVVFLMRRVRRLADLLRNPSGEIADLALLPGLGDRRLQRSVLLRETLVRPLAYYGLGLGGITLSGWVLLRVSQVPTDPMRLLAVVPSSTLVLFAMMTVGVLAGRLGRESAWFDASMAVFTPVMSFFLITEMDALSPQHYAPHLSTWESIVWVTVLGAMVVCLVRWGILLSRRPNLLCW